MFPWSIYFDNNYENKKYIRHYIYDFLHAYYRFIKKPLEFADDIEKDKHWQILLKKCNTSQLLQYDKNITCKNNSQYKNCRGVFTSCKIKDLTATDISNGFKIRCLLWWLLW